MEEDGIPKVEDMRIAKKERKKKPLLKDHKRILSSPNQELDVFYGNLENYYEMKR